MTFATTARLPGSRGVVYKSAASTLSVASTTSTSTPRAAQSFDMTARTGLRIKSIEWRAFATRDYTLSIGGVNQGSAVSVTAGDWYKWDNLNYEMRTGQRRTVSVAGDTSSGHYFTTGNATLDTHLALGPWIEPYPNERVPVNIEYYPEDYTWLTADTTPTLGTDTRTSTSYSRISVDITADAANWWIESVMFPVDVTQDYSGEWAGVASASVNVRQYEHYVVPVGYALKSGATATVRLVPAPHPTNSRLNFLHDPPGDLGDLTVGHWQEPGDTTITAQMFIVYRAH
jgi:hypothetical protein